MKLSTQIKRHPKASPLAVVPSRIWAGYNTSDSLNLKFRKDNARY